MMHDCLTDREDRVIRLRYGLDDNRPRLRRSWQKNLV